MFLEGAAHARENIPGLCVGRCGPVRRQQAAKTQVARFGRVEPAPNDGAVHGDRQDGHPVHCPELCAGQGRLRARALGQPGDWPVRTGKYFAERAPRIRAKADDILRDDLSANGRKAGGRVPEDIRGRFAGLRLHVDNEFSASGAIGRGHAQTRFSFNAGHACAAACLG